MTRPATVRARIALAALCVLGPARAAVAQQADIPVQAGVAIDRDSVTVGDVVRLTVRVRAPLGATINFPAAVDSLGPVQSLEPPIVRDGADSASGADRVATYRLVPWDVGTQPIRLGDVMVQTDHGDRRIALTLPSLFVRSVLPKDTALRVPKPARPLLEIRAPTPWWWLALVALAAVALALLVWWLFRRSRRTVVSPPDPYRDATAAFAGVERLHLVEAGEPGRHAALMTDVLRRYLADRIDGVSLAQTTAELLAAARGTPTVSVGAMRGLLQEVDAVKFARAPISPDRAREIGEEARTIVREEHTRAAEIASAADAPAERAA